MQVFAFLRNNELFLEDKHSCKKRNLVILRTNYDTQRILHKIDFSGTSLNRHKYKFCSIFKCNTISNYNFIPIT